MITTVYLIACLLRVAIVWVMTEILKHIGNRTNGLIATLGFLLYVAYLILNTYLGGKISPEAVLRLAATLVFFIGILRDFQTRKKGDDR